MVPIYDEDDSDVSIRKVKFLQGRLREQANRQELSPNDLVVVTTRIGSLPEFELEKIEGDPLTYLLKLVG